MHSHPAGVPLQPTSLHVARDCDHPGTGLPPARDTNRLSFSFHEFWQAEPQRSLLRRLSSFASFSGLWPSAIL